MRRSASNNPSGPPPPPSLSSEETFVASSPGRICLFGEHQDYLGLPVVPCAISLRVKIRARRRNDLKIHVSLPDIGQEEHFGLRARIPYRKERDYFRSGVNVMRRAGFRFSRGLDCTVHGTIPINTGTASSSALVVSWIALLAFVSDVHRQLSPGECARFAHEAEVLEFREPGGMMDHLAAAFGGVLTVDFTGGVSVRQQRTDLGAFVLGDSGEPKDTKGILSRVKEGVLEILRTLTKENAGFSLSAVTGEEVEQRGSLLPPGERALLAGTVRNRDITREASALLDATELDRRRLGELLNEHQAVLRDVLKISTPKIDGMIEAARHAGAYGAKINGSGGGGCMFAYAPELPERVAEAIASAGGKPYIVSVGDGTRAATGTDL
ncbi:MAG: galactokinase family protein [Bacteroidota bacterium]